MTSSALPELFVVEFPCGAFRTSRTLDGAKGMGVTIAKDRTCCEKGHATWSVWRFAPDQCVATSFVSPRIQTGAKPALRLVHGAKAQRSKT